MLLLETRRKDKQTRRSAVAASDGALGLFRGRNRYLCKAVCFARFAANIEWISTDFICSLLPMHAIIQTNPIQNRREMP